MDDDVLQRVFQEGGRRDYFNQTALQQPPTSSSSSILQSLPLHVVSTSSRLRFPSKFSNSQSDCPSQTSAILNFFESQFDAQGCMKLGIATSESIDKDVCGLERR
eukprot:TRINITY_DN5256_c0_g1_i7.p1 TRINITY_DN5256_c0_g1~~TRINITY_DN5256_c0_g1_i7.p1  ORF type:complete len:122 (-),score=23.23 TRINITY_DN5256_c0_g1_i7:176-490(-)